MIKRTLKGEVVARDAFANKDRVNSTDTCSAKTKGQLFFTHNPRSSLIVVSAPRLSLCLCVFCPLF